MDFISIKDNDKHYIASTYGRFDLAVKGGKGATLWDYDGKKYIDFTSGIGVNSLGFKNKKWLKATTKQLKTLQHISNLYYTEPCATLARELCQVTGYDKVVFANSGAEANECAIKAARKYAFDKKGEGHSKIITLVNSFHGRTVTTLSATGQDHFHNYFFPFTEGFDYVPANDFDALNNAIDDTVCAVMVEFVQGEGGVLALDKDYIKQVYDLCCEKDIIFIADEVQTGVGRTGKFLCSEHFGVNPHITTLAKGLGGGLPVGAVLLSDKISDVFSPGDHGSTFGGNPVACAGGVEIVKTISDKGFLEAVLRKGEKIRKRLKGCDEVKSVSGLGLMVGIELCSKDAKEVAKKCIEEGLLVLTAKSKVRLLPPLTISDTELSRGLDILIKVLSM